MGAELIDALMRFAKRRPYEHLKHADGSLYMGRWWVVPRSKWTFGYGLRIHHIATPDFDRHLHDHPFSFVSLVLKGWYIEARPVERDPCFVGDRELCYLTQRKKGSIAYRPCWARHRICAMSQGGVWTLVLTSPRKMWWGFFTETGKVHWTQYESVHE